MVDITHKQSTLRKAIAIATVETSSPETIEAIEQRKVPKGDVFEFSRAAALFGVKKTSDVIPDCHPLPVEYTGITFKIEGLSVIISVEVHTVYKTGVEVEAMHGASVAALVMYDMLKPIDKKVEIRNIRLLEKKGGKSGDPQFPAENLKAAVVVCSDSIHEGKNEDISGKTIISQLEKQGFQQVSYTIVPDECNVIQKTLAEHREGNYDLVIFTGGTGVSARDVTPDALLPMIDRPMPGIMETARRYGQERIKTAMLSRSIAGFSGKTLVLAFPGSEKAAEEYMQSLFPQVLHVFQLKENYRH